MKLIALALLLFASPALADIEGVPRVLDGDTLEIDNERIRLHGIDAPETKQYCTRAGIPYSCGVVATRALREKIAGRAVRCTERARGKYKRPIAVCFAGDVNLNAWMVQQGHAVAYRRYSKDYVVDEKAARSARRGIWAGAFEVPENWRKAQR